MQKSKKSSWGVVRICDKWDLQITSSQKWCLQQFGENVCHISARKFGRTGSWAQNLQSSSQIFVTTNSIQMYPVHFFQQSSTLHRQTPIIQHHLLPLAVKERGVFTGASRSNCTSWYHASASTSLQANSPMTNNFTTWLKKSKRHPNWANAKHAPVSSQVETPKDLQSTSAPPSSFQPSSPSAGHVVTKDCVFDGFVSITIYGGATPQAPGKLVFTFWPSHQTYESLSVSTRNPKNVASHPNKEAITKYKEVWKERTTDS